jgi:hypothetical protein
VGAAVRCGLEMTSMLIDAHLGWEVRVGVHAGPVVAGVVGQERYQFDIWGDTVNVATRRRNPMLWRDYSIAPGFSRQLQPGDFQNRRPAQRIDNAGFQKRALACRKSTPGRCHTPT